MNNVREKTNLSPKARRWMIWESAPNTERVGEVADRDGF